MNSLFPADFALCDGVMRVLCLSHKGISKSDGFIFALNGRFMLHDGGNGGCDLLDRMLALREAVCPGGVLHFDWYVSHYHRDHIDAPVSDLLGDSRFALDRVVLPPVFVMPEGMKNTSLPYNEKIKALLSEHYPSAELTEMGYASEGAKPIGYAFSDAKITVMPPASDWSSPEMLRKLAREYFCTDDIWYKKVQSSVTNNSSLWLMIEYGGKKLLFTGDSQKRTRHLTDEGFDRMFALYRDMIGKPDFVKWPHHGHSEDEADIMIRELDPDYILTTAKDEGASVQYAKTFPDFRAELVNAAKHDVMISLTPDGAMTVEGGKRGVNDGEYFVLDIPGKKVASD